MTDTEKDLLRQQNMMLFIAAAQELIDSDGMENISIRKIAAKAGFHNSTIYLYFKDAEELVALASVKYFYEYSHALSEISREKKSPYEVFMNVWELFADSAFKKPVIFYNFFFGKHSDNVTDTMTEYYRLFPQEKETYSQEIELMYFGKNIQERCRNILKPLLNQGMRITEDNLETANSMIVSCLKYLLEEKCQNPDLDSDILKKQLLQMMEYIVK